MAPKVSIIILNWNGKEDALECLESVYRIDYPSYEVIVVDNGSTGNTKEIIESKYRDKVRYFYQENKGASAVRNMGIKESKGECLVFFRCG